MTISIANRLYRPNNLSELERLILALIDGGAAWLDWASKDPGHHYHFRDGAELLSGLQSTLHGTSLLLLDTIGLLVSPIKLMSLGAEGLRHLIRPDQPASAVEELVRRHDLVTEADLTRLPAFLAQLGVEGALVFQTRTLADLITLVQLQREVDAAAPLTVEAAHAALALANGIAEFVDYLRLYLGCTSALTLADTKPDVRAAAIEQAIAALQMETFGALDGPVVEGLVAPWEVEGAVRHWLLMGRQFGFVRASLVMQQFVADGRYKGETGRELSALFGQFVSRAQAVLNAASIGEGVVSQDGQHATYPFEANGEVGQVVVATGGQIALGAFGRRVVAHR
ncbi:hypothetical protein [Sphingomonas sp.]|uniref:hypothetical protein n=1 Tax=Sphingomonas sp. TaxID=28214 RepID=UPI003B3BA05B